jgi:hypothetical protein
VAAEKAIWACVTNADMKYIPEQAGRIFLSFITSTRKHGDHVTS